MKTSVAQTCLVGPEIRPEQFIAEHLFFYLVNGTLSGYYGNGSYTLRSGEYGVVRKNRLGRLANPNDKADKIIFVFDEPFLRTFQEKHKLVAANFRSAESFLRTPDNELIPNFIRSLQPYYNDRGQIESVFFDVKREELLLILLQLQPELAGVFFNYGIPAKIDLEELNHNYKFNVDMQRFAYLTGRSLSAFKRDFKQLFSDTPGHWLVQRRLQEAQFLIAKGMKPSEFYFDLGFQDLSHFSFSFKKCFGINPTEVAQGRKEVTK
jgi:AraC-like DNA-binding protein